VFAPKAEAETEELAYCFSVCVEIFFQCC